MSDTITTNLSDINNILYKNVKTSSLQHKLEYVKANGSVSLQEASSMNVQLLTSSTAEDGTTVKITKIFPVTNGDNVYLSDNKNVNQKIADIEKKLTEAKTKADSASLATKADALNVANAIGNTVTPVFIGANGKPSACTPYSNATVSYASNASIATRLNNSTQIGATVQPVYFGDNGKPSSCVAYSKATVSHASTAENATNADSLGGVDAGCYMKLCDAKDFVTLADMDGGTVIPKYASSAFALVSTNKANHGLIETITLGNNSTPVYFSSGVPVTCNNLANVKVKNASSADYATIAGALDTDGVAVGTKSIPVYIKSNGKPAACTEKFVVGVTTNQYVSAPTDGTNFKNTLIHYNDGTSNGIVVHYANRANGLWAHDTGEPRAVGNASTPVYFGSNGTPIACSKFTVSTLKLDGAVGGVTIPTYFGADGMPSACTPYSTATVSAAKHLVVTDEIGNSTTPVYFNHNGNPVTCTPYSNAVVSKANSLNLTTSVGSPTNPVYFGANGLPSACTVADYNTGDVIEFGGDYYINKEISNGIPFFDRDISNTTPVVKLAITSLDEEDPPSLSNYQKYKFDTVFSCNKTYHLVYETMGQNPPKKKVVIDKGDSNTHIKIINSDGGLYMKVYYDFSKTKCSWLVYPIFAIRGALEYNCNGPLLFKANMTAKECEDAFDKFMIFGTGTADGDDSSNSGNGVTINYETKRLPLKYYAVCVGKTY